MEFNPVGFRKLTEIESFGKIRTNRFFTLILVKQNGSATWGSTVLLKDSIVDSFESGDLLLMAWKGQYKADIFILTKENLEEHYK